MSSGFRVFGVTWLLAGMLDVRAQAQQPAPTSTETPAATATPNPAPKSVPASVPSPAATPATADTIQEVLIEAPEPVYVAPTLRDRIGRIWAPVRINGKGPFRLVLDTGASNSAVTAHVAESLGLTQDQSLTVRVHGVTGSAVVPAIRVARLEVGEMYIDSSTLPIVPDAFGGAEGVLGREGLLDKRIFADFGADRLVISRSHGDRAKVGYNIVPLKVTREGLLAADVRIGTTKVRAIIDTGGQQTVGNIALRDALMRRAPIDSRDEDIIGVTLDLQHGTNIRVPPLSFGTLTLRGVRVTFSDVFLFEHWKFDTEPTILIGMDVLGLFDKLIIDYKMHEMQIRTRDVNGGMRLHVDPNEIPDRRF